MPSFKSEHQHLFIDISHHVALTRSAQSSIEDIIRRIVIGLLLRLGQGRNTNNQNQAKGKTPLEHSWALLAGMILPAWHEQGGLSFSKVLKNFVCDRCCGRKGISLWYPLRRLNKPSPGSADYELWFFCIFCGQDVSLRMAGRLEAFVNPEIFAG